MSICKDQYSASPKELSFPNFLLSFSPELVERIVADVDSPADLLNLALICKALHYIVVPFHLHFRKLHLNIRTAPLALWYGIIVKPRLASCFRTFHAHSDEQGDVYPSILVQEGEAYLARTLTSLKIDYVLWDAISRLTGLVKFNYTALQWIPTSQILWTLSTSCPLIQEINLHPIGNLSTLDITPAEIQSTLVTFPSLQSLMVNFDSVGHDDVRLCFEILAVGRFPNLKVLRLLKIYHTPNTPPAIIMKSVTIPQLREFRLDIWSNFHFQDTTEHNEAAMVYGFLARHPQLRIFSAYSAKKDFWQPLLLERDHCSNLRVLCLGDVEVANVVSPSLAGQLQKLSGSIGSHSLRFLEHISMLQEWIIHISNSLPINFLLSLPISTERLFVKIYRELDANVQVQPFTSESALCINTNRYQTNSAPFDYIPYLTRLQNLTHVGGFNWDPSFIAEEKKVFLEKFSTKLE
ncbi:hypothetical protein M422DRAFT_268490 [Sphaerobolus stellatus SS14]|uniref:F-box domain-containing protein n=1 Tax=Sphaerobolus stellatus (strain SS14) TaxID=990650 RepID=A0A0C9U6W4_SPHS4|nr:hypothetical protein M422DRAFT_268490 [Sphaerobolus stellatus SS14]